MPDRLDPQRAISARTPQSRIVLGIDPGTIKLGWGVVAFEGAAVRWLASGVLRPSARESRPVRLGILLQQLTELFDLHQPHVVAVETAFVRADPRAALVLGEARGLPMALGASRGMAVVELSPSEVKRAVVGRGRATKEQVQEMVRIQLCLDVLPAEDEADALAIALTAIGQLRRTGAQGMVPRARTRAAAAPSGDAPTMTAGRAYYAAVLAAAQGRKGGRR